jgi:voltage-gated potassium channel
MYGFKSPLDPFYFSFTTMSSVGYGDFSPKTDLAKMIVMSQQIFILVGVMEILGMGRAFIKQIT